MTVAHSPAAHSLSFTADKEASVIVAHIKNRNSVAEDDIACRRTPRMGAQSPLASHPSFSQQKACSNSLELSDSVNTNAAVMGTENVSLDRLWSLGNYCSLDHNARIELWVDELTHHEEMHHMKVINPITTELYKDWLNWSKDAAIAWLGRLDKMERRFRIASLNYHSTPYTLRHSVTLLHGSRIDQVALSHLSEILETDRNRIQQPFFIPWYEIKHVATEILEDLDYHEPLSDDLVSLRTINNKFGSSFLKLPKALRTLKEGLQWLEDAAAEVSDRSGLDGSDVLASKYSLEGGLFRRWMMTLPEVDYKFVESKSKYIEWYVERLLEVGVEKDQYWSNLVELSGQKNDPPEM